MEPKKTTQISKPETDLQVNSPAEMIRIAVSGGADLEKLKGLLDLQERWEANEARKAYHRAMSEFKANPPKIKKDKKVSYKDVRYSHASLANVVEQITKELSKHGLSASWSTKQNGQIAVTCRITHVQGHSEETCISAQADATGSKNSIQAIGSTITYLERYTLLSALGLATYDQDDDARSAVVEDKIDEKQLSTIVDYINLTKTDEAKFLKYLGIDAVASMPKSLYQKALTALQAKEKKNACA